METIEDSNDIKCRDRELMNREHGQIREKKWKRSQRGEEKRSKKDMRYLELREFLPLSGED